MQGKMRKKSSLISVTKKLKLKEDEKVEDEGSSDDFSEDEVTFDRGQSSNEDFSEILFRKFGVKRNSTEPHLVRVIAVLEAVTSVIVSIYIANSSWCCDCCCPAGFASLNNDQ